MNRINALLLCFFMLAIRAVANPEVIYLSGFKNGHDLISYVAAKVGPTVSLGKMLPTGSMVPTINADDFVVIDRKFPFGRVQLNDVVAFESGTLTTHRVVGFADGGASMAEGRKLVTKGDAHDAPDSYPVSRRNYQGKVVFIIKNDLGLADFDATTAFPASRSTKVAAR